MDRTARRLPVPLLSCLLLVAVGCGSSPPATHPAATSAEPPQTAIDDPVEEKAPPPRSRLRYRFVMESPPNEDFAFRDEDIHIYLRPFEDNLSFKIQARTVNFIRIFWDQSEFVDILGLRYKLVPPGMDFNEAAFGIPPTDVPAGQVYQGRLRLLDPTNLKAIQRLGGNPFPIVPPEAGTPEQILNETFLVNLVLELNQQRRDYEFLFSIRDVYLR